MHNIAAPLVPFAVDVDTLKPLKGNPRKGDVESVRRSFRRFGQRKPIVCMADGTITAGHHMHAAAIAEGWTEVAAIFIDEDEIEAKGFSIADNRTGDLGRYDNQALVDMLIEIRDEDIGLLDDVSYTTDDIEDLLAFLAGPTVPDPVDDGGDTKDPKVIVCPDCGCHFTA